MEPRAESGEMGTGRRARVGFGGGLLQTIQNRYVLAGALFLAWMCFFDRNDFITQIHFLSQRQELTQKAEFYRAEIARTRAERDDLMTNQTTLERFAREKYRMKRPNEELFIIPE